MEISKISWDDLEYHPKYYNSYLKKHPEFLVWPGLEHLTPKAIDSLWTVTPVSVVANNSGRFYLIAGIRTYLAATICPPTEIHALVYLEGELSSKAVHEIICADFYLSVLPQVFGRGRMADLITVSQSLPPRILDKWFQFPRKRKCMLSKILPVTDSYVRKVLEK